MSMLPYFKIKKINYLTTVLSKFFAIFQLKNARIKKQFIVTVTMLLLHGYKNFTIYFTLTNHCKYMTATGLEPTTT